MGLKEIINNAHTRWMDSDGPEHDIVISSRIRVARNIAGVPFPNLMKQPEAESVFHYVQQAISKPQETNCRLELVQMSQLSQVERRILMEKHLISPDLLTDPEMKAVILSDDEVISIMLNEEDHLRIQCLLPGLQLNKAWQVTNEIDDYLEQTIDYAFSDQLGYLTACPTNVGTGLRASVMLHLPGLTMVKQINRVINAVTKLGLTVRGLYGEGTQAAGNLYQISNQVTLGLTEEEIINKLTLVIKEIIDQERAARKALHRERKNQLEDRVFRAYGTLKCARLLTSDEAMKLISEVRLGVDLGIIQQIPPEIMNELIMLTRPAYLVKKTGRVLKVEERDSIRAEIVRNKLHNF